MTTFTSTLDAALRYAAIGWPVFPCRPDKKPHTAHGFHEATTDEGVIVAWWRRWPDAQIGVACGGAGLCVVDLDLGKGKDGIAAFQALKDNRPDWCELVAATPRGGRHMIYLMPEDPIGCSVDILPGSGIDVRGSGGYIVVPSPASPGREWCIGDPFESDLTQMPEWVEHLIRGRRVSVAKGQDGPAMPLLEEAKIREALAFIDPNPRDTWIRVGMALKSTGAREAAYQLWKEWSEKSPKFDEGDQRYQWQSLREFRADGSEISLGTLFHMAKEGGYVGCPEPEFFPEPAPAPKKRPFPAHLARCPGLVGEVTSWMLESSTRQQPAMCLASALVTLGAVVGRRVATETDLRSNIYCLGIGETACGKDPSVRLPHLLLTRAGLGQFVGPGEWKSDSGLRAALQDAPSHAAYVDEFTKMLQAMSGPQVPGHVKGIKKYLLDLYAASNSVHLSVAYANRQLNKPVVLEQPNLCVYGTGVPGELFTSLDRGAVSDGFLNRFLVFFADDQQPERRKVGRAEPPEDLLAAIKVLDVALGHEVTGGISSCASTATIIPFASAILDSWERENDQRIRTMREAGDPLADLWVRFGAHVAKLALIRSVCIDPKKPIEESDLLWARDVVVWSTERMVAEAGDRVADSAQEALTKRVLRVIEETGSISASDLTRKTQWLRRSDRKDILQTLIESGQVVSRSEEADGGKIRTLYERLEFKVNSRVGFEFSGERKPEAAQAVT